MAATLYGDGRMVEILLKHGADANQANASRATALMWAAHDAEKVRLLLARGADVNARSESERTLRRWWLLHTLERSRCRACFSTVAPIFERRTGLVCTALASPRDWLYVDVARFLVGRGPQFRRPSQPERDEQDSRATIFQRPRHAGHKTCAS